LSHDRFGEIYGVDYSPTTVLEKYTE